MTDKPTADEARLREIAERANMVVGKLGLCSTAEAYSIIEHELPWLLSQLTAALTAALAQAEAAEKERDELLKHCTALERASFENLIEHEKWQEREAVYKSQIEAGAKRIEAAEKALEPPGVLREAERAALTEGWVREDHDFAEAVLAKAVALFPCSDCPPAGYPTDKTRCGPCPRRIRSAAGGQ
jgi:hypothetical protein